MGNINSIKANPPISISTKHHVSGSLAIRFTDAQMRAIQEAIHKRKLRSKADAVRLIMDAGIFALVLDV